MVETIESRMDREEMTLDLPRERLSRSIVTEMVEKKGEEEGGE